MNRGSSQLKKLDLKHSIPIAEETMKRVSSARASLEKSESSSSRSFLRPNTSRTGRSAMRMTKTEYMRVSCTELRTATQSFSQLLDFTKEFMKINLMQYLDPKFPEDLLALTSTFDIFSQQIVALYSTVRKSAMDHSFTPVSPVFQAAQNFTMRWVDYIEAINFISDNNVCPYQDEINKSFATLHSSLSHIQSSSGKKQFVSKELTTVILRLKKKLSASQKELSDIFVIYQESIPVEVNVKKYHDFFHTLVRDTTNLMDRVLPMDILAPTEGTKLKSDIITACSKLNYIITAISVFPDQVTRIKAQIVDFNKELTNINRFMNLPFTVTLTVEENGAEAALE